MLPLLPSTLPMVTTTLVLPFVPHFVVLDSRFLKKLAGFYSLLPSVNNGIINSIHKKKAL
jgi:hypothetical protein